MSKKEPQHSITMTLNTEKLKKILNTPLFKQKLMAAAYVDLKVTRYAPLPGVINSGAATEETSSFFRQFNMHNLPAGQYCQTCHEGSGILFQQIANGRKSRVCKGCKDKTCNVQDGEIFALKFILPPLTSTPVNLIFPLIRKSNGGRVNLVNLQFLYSFIRNWSRIPNRSTHVQWIVDIYGSSASALALHSDMVWRLSKFHDDKTNKEMFQSMSHLLPQMRATMRMNMDSVTIAVPTMATFGVKTSNLEDFLKGAEDFGIPLDDIYFVMYGIDVDKKSVIFDPICKSGTEILADIKALKCIPGGEIEKCGSKWLRNLDHNCHSRVFTTGLAVGRTLCGAWTDFPNKDVVKAREAVQENRPN